MYVLASRKGDQYHAARIIAWSMIPCNVWRSLDSSRKHALVDRYYNTYQFSISGMARSQIVADVDAYCQDLDRPILTPLRPAGDATTPASSTPSASSTTGAAPTNVYGLIGTALNQGIGLAENIINNQNKLDQQKLLNDSQVALASIQHDLATSTDAQQRQNLSDQNQALQGIIAALQRNTSPGGSGQGLSTGAKVAIGVGAVVVVGGIAYLATRGKRRHNPVVRIKGRKKFLSASHARSRRRHSARR